MERIWHEAFTAMRLEHHLPVEERTTESSKLMRRRIGHLLETDPDGSLVAERGREPVGFAQAFVRDDLWVLSLLAVSPDHQEQGTGRSLLDAATSYRRDARFGLILCSRDPRAARIYSKAGFDLHPAVAAWGRVDHRNGVQIGGDRVIEIDERGFGGCQVDLPEVREGTVDDLRLVRSLGRRLRGGDHAPEIAFLIGQGRRLLLAGDQGYAVVQGARPVMLAADNEAAATTLLSVALSLASPDEGVTVNWITAGQQWAIRTSLAFGLQLHPLGPVMTRGFDSLPACYLPSGAFG